MDEADLLLKSVQITHTYRNHSFDSLKGSITEYDDATEPVAENDWEVLS